MQFQLPIADAVLQFAVLGTAVLVVQLTLERLHLPGITGLLVRLRGVLPPPSTLHAHPLLTATIAPGRWTNYIAMQ
jgi:hypothetical protein